MRTERILHHSTSIMSDITQKVEKMKTKIKTAVENISIETQAETLGILILFKRVHKIVKKRLLASSFLSVFPYGNNSATAGRIFMKFDIGVFFENLSGK
jgi:hypothetical protein